jgi:hypothetical protein
MASTELPRPGVSVIQQFRTVSPTIVTPTLVPCVIGPCFQVVEALETDATGNSVVNTDAVASLPPILTAENAEDYQNLDGTKLKVSVNNGPEQEVEFSDPTAVGLTADQVKSQILATSGISGWAPYTVTMGSSTYLQLRGNNAGDGQSLKILDGDANSYLGFPDFFEVTGFSTYTQDKRLIAQANFPDPRGNIDEIDVDEDSIRVFFNTGSALFELERDESFLQNGYDAYVVGTAAITFPTTALYDTTLEVTLEEGGTEQEVTFAGEFFAIDGTVVVPAGAYSQPGTDSIKIQKNNDTAVVVTFSTPADIDAAITAINAAWAAVYTGQDVAYRALADGSADGAGTFIAFQVGGATATGDHVNVQPGDTGDAYTDVGFTNSGNMYDSLVWFINNALNAPTAEPVASEDTTTSDALRLQSWDGYIMVDKAGTGNTILKFSAASHTEQYALVGVDDGDGDTKSPLIRIQTADFTKDPSSAQITGTQDLTGDIEIHRLTLQMAIDGYPMQEIEFNGGPIIADQAAGAFPGSWDTQILKMVVNGTNKQVTFAAPTDMDDVVNQINTAAGQVVVYRSNSSGVPDVAGTYLTFQVGGSTDAGGEIVLTYTGSTAWTNVGFTSSADEKQVLTSAEIETAIEDTMGTGAAAIVSNKLQLDSAELGEESKIEIGTGTANAVLGLTDNDVAHGLPFKPKAGDAVYANGEFLGNIAQVAPGAVSTDLRLDRKLSYQTVEKKNWYIIAKEIDSTLPADRPTPNLVVDLAGDITLKHDIMRDTRGDPVATVADPIVISYKALRLDVTAAASNPALLVFEDTTELETALEPLDTDNPLGLGLFLALLNAPGVTVAGLGVDAVTADAPGGTLLAYSKAMTFLESEEVYALAPLTQEAVVHQAFQTHVNSMSDPDARGERIVFINPEMPDRELDTLVASGTDGDTTGVTNEFDTKLSNLAALLLAAGVDPTGTITVDDGVYLDIASDAKRYSVASLSSTVVTIRVTFAPGENDDAYYSADNLPTQLISESFAVKIRGNKLETSTGDPDYAEIASTYGDLATAYGDRRVVLTAPDQCGASIDGLEQLIEGYYMNAAIAGMVGQQPPQQGFTNFPMAGFTRVVGSNDVFSNTQMNIAAGGGVYWVVQDVVNGPLTSRHQLTTDMTSIETRELSITKVVDFCAKFMRAGLRNFIGKFNITQGFLDTLSTVIQGQLSYLAETGVIIGGDLNNIVQDTSAPDTVLIDVTLDVPYPCNYIRLTLVV